MSAVLPPLPLGEGWGEGGLRVAEPSAKYIVQLEAPLIRGFELLATAQGGVDSLRELILSLAVRGLLVQQSADDAPASAVVRAVRQAKVAVSDARMTKRDERLASIADDELPYRTPTGWAWVRLGELLTKFGAGSTPLGGREVYTTTGVKFSRSQNVWNHGLALGGVAFIPAAVHEKMGGTKVFAGDLLFNITGASIGRCAPVPESFDEGNVSQHVTILRTALPSIRPFLHLVLISVHVQQTVRDVQVGVSREGLSIAKLGQFVIPLPPLAEQHRIVARVEELMKLCDALEQSGRLAAQQHARLTSTLFDALAASESARALAENWQRIAEHFDLLLDRPGAIDALEQTVLQLAVRGVLVPQDASDESAADLLVRIQSERDRLTSEGQIRKAKPAPLLGDDALPYALPCAWAWARFGAVVHASEAGWSPNCEGGQRTGTSWGVLKVSAVSWGEFRSYENKELPKHLEPRTEFEVRNGDFLISRANTAELVARSVVVSKAEPRLMMSDKIIRLRLSSLVDRDFFNLVNNSRLAREYYAANASGTSSSMKNVGREVILSMPVPVPPLAEQHRIVARVEELRRLCAQLRERLTEARATQSRLADALVSDATT